MRIQQPIQSEFNALSTVNDVLSNIDLSSKTIIITGGHSGLGLESTKALAAKGASIIVGVRDLNLAQKNLNGLAHVSIKPLDLANIESIKSFAESILSSNIKIDILLCNAGVMALPKQKTASSWEMQFAINHIGHYVLTNLIWNSLNIGARVVSVSSAGHHNASIDFNDIHFDYRQYDKWLAYGQSKTANALFALQLDEYGKDSNIRAFSVHPGKIFTPLQRHLTTSEMIEAGWLDSEGNPADPTFKTPAQGAATQVWAATSPALENLGGLYCEDCNIAKSVSDSTEAFQGVCDYVTDPNLAKKLWNYTAEITGINAFSD